MAKNLQDLTPAEIVTAFYLAKVAFNRALLEVQRLGDATDASDIAEDVWHAANTGITAVTRVSNIIEMLCDDGRDQHIRAVY